MNSSTSASNTARRVLVTGASRGLGLAFVGALLTRGDQVVAACRRPAEAAALQALASNAPERLTIHALDHTDAASRQALVAAVSSRWGGLDVLINNAGMLPTGDRQPQFGALNAESFREAFETNALGPMLMAEAFAPLLAQGRTSVVAFLSSKLGSISHTGGLYTPAYSVSKAALNMAIAQIAGALGERGIRSVSLHPGWVRTDMGGAAAPLLAPEAVAGMLQVIDQLPDDARGLFLDYQGHALPW